MTISLPTDADAGPRRQRRYHLHPRLRCSPRAQLRPLPRSHHRTAPNVAIPAQVPTGVGPAATWCRPTPTPRVHGGCGPGRPRLEPHPRTATAMPGCAAAPPVRKTGPVPRRPYPADRTDRPRRTRRAGTDTPTSATARSRRRRNASVRPSSDSWPEAGRSRRTTQDRGSARAPRAYPYSESFRSIDVQCAEILQTARPGALSTTLCAAVQSGFATRAS